MSFIIKKNYRRDPASSTANHFVKSKLSLYTRHCLKVKKGKETKDAKMQKCKDAKNASLNRKPKTFV
jgi:hypothetical protein